MYWSALFLVTSAMSCLEVSVVILVSVESIGSEAGGCVFWSGCFGGVVVFILCS